MQDSSSKRRALFRAARAGFDPGAAERVRVERALGRRLGVAATTIAATTAAASIARAATGAGTGAGASAGAAGAGAGVSLVLPAKWIGAALLVAAVGGGSASVVLTQRGAPIRAGTVLSAQPASAPAPTAPAASLEIPASGAPALAAVASASPPNTQVEPRIATRRVTAPVSVSSSPPPAPAARVAAEARLLRRADEALREGDAARAMTLLDDHARAYPNGVLSEERSAERVSALCKIGRVAEAKREAARFLQATPDSPLAGTVRSSCGGTSTGR
jgi:hypothetical protein